MARTLAIDVPEERSAFPVLINHPVAWGDLDAYGHVNNVTYLYYFENARMAYFNQIGISELMEGQKLGPIVGSTDCTYRSPLHHPDTVRIGTRIARIGNASFEMQQCMWSEQQQTIVAKCVIGCVYMDYGIGKPCSFPEILKERVALLESRS